MFHVSAEVVETSNRTPPMPEKCAIGYGAIVPQIENVLRDSLVAIFKPGNDVLYVISDSIVIGDPIPPNRPHSSMKTR